MSFMQIKSANSISTPRALWLGSIILGVLVVKIAGGGTSTSQPTTQASHTSNRLPQRRLLDEREYKAVAEKLRAEYSGPHEQWPQPTVDAGVAFQELGPLPAVVFPENNPYSKEKESLGTQLFFDARLSGSGEIACASCHDPDLAWADGRTVAFGHGRTKLRRNSPSILLAAYAKSLFWDGRSTSLEDQAQIPILAHDEMDGGPNLGIKRLNEIPGYRQQFKTIFGSEEVTMANVARAIATFERGLAKNGTGHSPFDRFLAGKPNALNDSAIRGLHLFRTDARCINCHNGAALTDNQFHDIGLSYYGRKFEDLGRFNVTNDPKDVGKFRTPSLRNVARTRPYMHNGLFELEGVIAAYNSGMGTLRRQRGQENDPMFPSKDTRLKSLDLNEQDRADLLAFLESLSEPLRRIEPPPLPDGPHPTTAAAAAIK
jgi:cytochrome c peroxidase